MAASRKSLTAAAAADGGVEENAMAILDTFGIKDSRDLHDDRTAFFEAVRSACLAGDSPSPPSWRMHNAVFQILQSSSSLEVTIASFHLLLELDKHYPRTYLTNPGPHQALVIVEESWSPFLPDINVARGEIGGNTSRKDHLFDPLRFGLLIEDMVEAANDTSTNNRLKRIENMVLFQYLVSTLEADFVPRNIAYKESLDWVIIRESLLSVLLRSRNLVFKSFVKNCISLLNQQQREVEAKISFEAASDSDSSLTFSLLEFEREALLSVKKLFIMVINLDLIRKEADKLNLTSRVDGSRNPILEVILDELPYNTINLSPFLLAFTEWKWKLEIILQYFLRYYGKPAVRTRRSDDTQQDLTVENVLSLFSTAASAKAMAKKMFPEVAQLLLAHAYQACLSIQVDSSKADDATKMIGATLLEISCKFVSAFQNLRECNTDIEISQFEKEALFTATTLTRKLQNE
ncbi:negative regulator of systemic acquired resistance SNI1 isoform X1 [Lolium perenne]|uniref:negative regulator of systemic acquired resistance SNI1 isoform X1 n=1 Tax=Lolium perenne TaxID=4522 RepID=UPI0021F54505|nr:negative regulator of systemic acquired resistance SNI1 isoform X1 [Lolium perenne]